MVGCRFKEEPQVTLEKKGKASRQRKQQSQRPAIEVACSVPGTAQMGLGEEVVRSGRQWREPVEGLGATSWP